MTWKESKFFSSLPWKFLGTKYDTNGISTNISHSFEAGEWKAEFSQKSNPAGAGESLAISKGNEAYDYWSWYGGSRHTKVFRKLLKLEDQKNEQRKERLLTTSV